jgi:hypothetical protein
MWRRRVRARCSPDGEGVDRGGPNAGERTVTPATATQTKDRRWCGGPCAHFWRGEGARGKKLDDNDDWAFYSNAVVKGDGGGGSGDMTLELGAGDLAGRIDPGMAAMGSARRLSACGACAREAWPAGPACRRHVKTMPSESSSRWGLVVASGRVAADSWAGW